MITILVAFNLRSKLYCSCSDVYRMSLALSLPQINEFNKIRKGQIPHMEKKDVNIECLYVHLYVLLMKPNITF